MKYMTMTEIATMLEVEYSTISSYHSRKQMPEPDAVFGRTPVWKPTTIKKWLTGRKVNA